MKKLTTVTSTMALGLSVALFATGCANNGNNASAANSASANVTITEQSPELEKVGYSLGYMMAEGNKEVIDDLNLDAFDSGFRAGYEGKDPSLTKEQMEEVLLNYQQKKEAEFAKELQDLATKNKEAGQKFLADNAKKDGVQTTDSGLQYKVVKEGTGKTPTPDDVVKVNYKGTLLDGTVFDSSFDRGEPAVFAVSNMIPGFAEGLQKMKEGGTYELYIPADIAYGEAGNPSIEPNSTLVFTVDMIEVNPEAPQAAQ